MALIVNDRVKESSVTTGTGTFTLDGAETGFETFSSAIGNTNTTYYAIEIPNTVHFEVGLGTVGAGTLARTSGGVISSSNSDGLVDFPAGTKNVFCTLPASKAVIEDNNNDVTLPADLTVGANLDVSSGTIKLDGNYPEGSANVVLGDAAGDALTGSSSSNTLIGHQAGTDMTIGFLNTAVGTEAMTNVTDGAGNNAFGNGALRTEVGGNSNTAIGEGTLDTQSGASQNTALGVSAGGNVTTGSNLTLLGYNAQPSSATATNEVTLGDANVTSLRIPGIQSGASSGDVLTYDGTDIGLSAPTGVSAGFSIAMAIAL